MCARKSPPDHPSATSCLLKDALEVFAPLTLFPLQARHTMRTTDDGKQFLKQGAARYLALAFALAFLVFQSSTLVHSHAGDLNKHLDCTFCLKAGAGDELVPVTAVAPDIPQTRLAPVVRLPSFSAVFTLTPRSRSPPL